jgi:hypothetical protein
VATDPAGDGPFERLWQSVDVHPGGAAWAVLRIPVHPGIEEHNPATVHWRTHRVDPDLCGLVPGRAHAAQLEFSRPDGDGPWRLPVAGVTGARLAWHPDRPLVAGLAVRGRRLSPWVANLATRSVVTFPEVEAALSLTPLGAAEAAPMAWCGPEEVVLLTRGEAPTPPPPGPPAPGVYEAKGPGVVSFAPGHEELGVLAAATLSVLDVTDGGCRPVTPRLLVRRLRPSPTGRHTLIEYVTGDDPAERDGLRWRTGLVDTVQTGPVRPMPPAVRWTQDADVLAWREPAEAGPPAIGWRTMDGRELRTEISGPVPSRWWPLWRAGAPVVVAAGATGLQLTTPGRVHQVPLAEPLSRLGRIGAGGSVMFDCSHPDGRAGLAILDPDRPELVVAWASTGDADGPIRGAWAVDRGGVPELIVRRRGLLCRHRLHGDRLIEVERRSVGPTGRSLLTLADSAAGRVSTVPFGRVSVLDGPDRDGPRLLWLRAASLDTRPGDAEPPEPNPLLLDATGCAGAVLDVRLHWPADATAGQLRGQLVDAVRAALAMMGDGGPVVVAGHSFGATLALCALAEVAELSAAIAHSGAYNRTLTPIGFQYERRSYWQAPAVYQAFSALHFADRLDRPVLIVHGADDTNPATTPEQAVDLYRAIVASGGHARLVMLPGEDHNLRHRESLRAVVDEQRRWLDLHARVPERI